MPTSLLAAAPDAVAPVLASVLALAAFLIGVPVFITDSPVSRRRKRSKPADVAESDQPLEDQVGI